MPPYKTLNLKSCFFAGGDSKKNKKVFCALNQIGMRRCFIHINSAIRFQRNNQVAERNHRFREAHNRYFFRLQRLHGIRVVQRQFLLQAQRDIIPSAVIQNQMPSLTGKALILNVRPVFSANPPGVIVNLRALSAVGGKTVPAPVFKTAADKAVIYQHPRRGQQNQKQ